MHRARARALTSCVVGRNAQGFFGSIPIPPAGRGYHCGLSWRAGQEGGDVMHEELEIAMSAATGKIEAARQHQTRRVGGFGEIGSVQV